MYGLTALERSGLLILAVVLLVPPPLSPALIVVSGGCTLPDAVEAANSDAAVGGCSSGAGADTIRLTGDVSITAAHSGQNALPAIGTEIRLEGGGFSIERADGAPDFRLFQVGGGGDLTLSNVTVANGLTANGNHGGGILNHGILTVEDAAITGNFSGYNGGGIANFGTASVVNSTLSNNGNNDSGGGIYSGFSSEIAVVDSTLISNYSFWDGAGLFGYEGGVTITGSTISGNSPGGVEVFYPFGTESVVIANSTISGNLGGGVYIYGGYGYPVVRVQNSTVANNQLTNLGWSASTAADVEVANSIMAYGGTDCSGFMDAGGNFDSDGSCPGASAITGLDPALADNGGPTRTHALLPGSSAIDAGGACGLLVDQRGFGRDAACDSGAFEFDAAPAVVTSVGGLTPQAARCGNVTAGGTVEIPGSTSWNCRAAGLAIDSGDRVRQTVRGKPRSSQFTGSIEGIGNGRVMCQNLLTGQSVAFPLHGATTWNCRAEGLDFSADNVISWTVTGFAE